MLIRRFVLVNAKSLLYLKLKELEILVYRLALAIESNQRERTSDVQLECFYFNSV